VSDADTTFLKVESKRIHVICTKTYKRSRNAFAVA